MRIRNLTRPLAAIPLLAGLALAGCGSSSPSNSASSGVRPNLQVSASGSFNHTPTVTIPARQASADLVIRTLVTGTGATIAARNVMLADYVVYTWNGATHKLADSSFARNAPQLFTSIPQLPGLQRALVGQKAGSRVLAVVPPKFGFGSTGNPQVGITAKTTLVFLFDVLGVYAPNAIASGATVSSGGGTLPRVTTPTSAGPTVVIPKNSPPTSLVAKTLIKGTGRAVGKGDYLVAQYVGYNWRTGKSFDSSWSTGSMLGSPLNKLNVAGFVNGLPGQTVGSRVMLVIPPSQAYGSKGKSSAGINPGDTLVFVVDIIDSVPPAS
jgi:FKBP-type peptidyl-prolyl cis-trans isomerase